MATAKKKAPAKKAATVKKGLTVQQRLFVAEYLKDRNGTQAASRAGYAEVGAAVQANRLLSNANVQQEIEAFVMKIEQKVGLSVERTLLEVARLAYFDPRKLLNADGSPKPVQDLDDDTAAGIAGLEVLDQYEGSGNERVFTGQLKKYKIADKNAALEKAMKHLGLYERDNEQKTNPLTDLLKAIGGKSALPVHK
jgi:phage terminase small subunit